MTHNGLPSRTRATAPVYLLICLGTVLTAIILAFSVRTTREATTRLDSFRAVREDVVALNAHLELMERSHTHRMEAEFGLDPTTTPAAPRVERSAPAAGLTLPNLRPIRGMPERLDELEDLTTRIARLEDRARQWKGTYVSTLGQLQEHNEKAIAHAEAIRNALLSIRGKQRLLAAKQVREGKDGPPVPSPDNAATDRLLVELLDTSVAISAMVDAKNADAVTNIAANRLVPILYRLRATVSSQAKNDAGFDHARTVCEELAEAVLGKESAGLAGFVSIQKFKTGLIADCARRLGSLQERERLVNASQELQMQFSSFRVEVTRIADGQATEMRTSIYEALRASTRQCLITGIIACMLFAVVGWQVLRTLRRYAVRVESVTVEVSAARDRAGAALRESEALRSTLDEHSIVSVADHKGRIVDVNQAFCRISGYSREELLGQDHRLINSGVHPRRFWVEMWRTIASGRAWRGEVCNRAKDRSQYWVDTIIAPFKGADGRIEKYVSIRTDITERKLAERSLAQFKHTLDQTLDCVFMFRSPDLKFVYVNEGAKRQVGFTEAELLAMTPTDIKPEFTPEQFRELVRPMLVGTQTSHIFETVHRHKDGREIPVEVSLQCVRKEGEEPRFVAMVRDITERRRTQQRSREAEEFLRSAIDSLDSHTVVLARDGRILSVNRAWKAFGEANGAAGRDVLEGADYLAVCDQAAPLCPESARVAAAVRTVLAGEAEPTPVEYACHSPSEQRWFLCSIRGFLRGADRYAVVSHLNITAVKEAEARLQATNAELVKAREAAEAASRAKSEFLANMSHEIRTPLTAILGFADILRDDGATPTPKEQRAATVDTIRNAGQHLLSVINDILDISKIEAEKMTVERIETPLVALLVEVESLMRPRAVGKGVALNLKLASPLPSRILADPTRLRQILMNLTGNAVKFTESGSVTVAAGVLAQCGRRCLVVDIEDTGEGMTPEQAGRLFAAFGQADTTVTRKHGGTGLGLTISRRLSQLMGGDVTLQRTSPGQGSCSRVVLPLEAVDGCEMIEALDAVQKISPRSSVGPKVTLDGRILLAEDGPDNQRLISFHLRKAGARVDVADNGRIALDMLDKAQADGTPYDMLLTDMQMPEMDGYTLARTLRDRGSTLAIVALTAHAMAEDRERCIASGCDDYAKKPIDKFLLLERCAHWIGRKGVSKVQRQAA